MPRRISILKIPRLRCLPARPCQAWQAGAPLGMTIDTNIDTIPPLEYTLPCRWQQTFTLRTAAGSAVPWALTRAPPKKSSIYGVFLFLHLDKFLKKGMLSNGQEKGITHDTSFPIPSSRQEEAARRPNMQATP